MSDLESEFHQAMIRIYQEAKEFDYFATRFRMMVEQYGGVETPPIYCLRHWMLKTDYLGSGNMIG